MRFCPIFVSLTLASGLGVSSARAQVKPSERPVRKITAETAVAEALKNNLTIAIVRTGREMVGYDLQAAYGIYDPTFSITASHSEANSSARFDSGSGVTVTGSTAQSDSVQQ